MESGHVPVDALLAALPNTPEARRDWRVWRVFSDQATRSEPLMMQFRESAQAWLQTTVTGIATHFGCTPDEARLDAEMVHALVDAIGHAAGVDPESWPIKRQRQLLEHCLARLSVAQPRVAAVPGENPIAT